MPKLPRRSPEQWAALFNAIASAIYKGTIWLALISITCPSVGFGII